ncbi:hypothetical protein NMY22_g6947 [Coprinellus aureogranulatus]|nr:hypothetical protein NMY22_g6947 [Coprinellus aureogranulatus]
MLRRHPTLHVIPPVSRNGAAVHKLSRMRRRYSPLWAPNSKHCWLTLSAAQDVLPMACGRTGKQQRPPHTSTPRPSQPDRPNNNCHRDETGEFLEVMDGFNETISVPQRDEMQPPQSPAPTPQSDGPGTPQGMFFASYQAPKESTFVD